MLPRGVAVMPAAVLHALASLPLNTIWTCTARPQAAFEQEENAKDEDRLVQEELRKSNELKRIQETLIAEELSIYEKEQDALLQSGELINVFFSVRHGDDGPVSPAHVFYIALLATV